MPTDLWEIAGWALACSVPVVLAGAIIIRLARSWSLAVSMVALVLGEAFLEKFGGDSIQETKRNYEAYLKQLREYPGQGE